MESYKTKFLIFLLLQISTLFANEKIDKMCGTWTYRNERNGYFLDNYWSLSLEKITDEEYFILYSSNSEDHVLDLSQVGTVISDNLIHIHKSEGEDFYVYLDYEENSVYFLWNHTEPSDEYYDTELKRVTELYDEELNKLKMKEFDENLKQGILKSIKK